MAFEYKLPLQKFKISNESIDAVTIKGDKIFITSVFYDGKNNMLSLCVLDKNKGNVQFEKKVISSLASDPFGVNGRKFDVTFSPDGKKMLVVSAFQWNKKPQVVKAEVYETSSLKIINTINLPDTRNDMLIKSSAYGITNEATIFYFILPDAKKEKDAPQREVLVIHSANSTIDKYVELPIENKYLQNYQTIQKDNQYVFTGAFRDDFSKKEKKENKIGVFYIVIDLEKASLVTSNFNYYSDDIHKKLTYKIIGDKDTKDAGEKTFSLLGVFKTKTGFYLVENHAYSFTYSSSQGSSTNTLSREYIVSKFNEFGKVEFSKIIPKYGKENMYGQDIVLSNNNLYLFYAEHPKNLKKYTLQNYDENDYEEVHNITGPTAVCVKIDEKGMLLRQTMFRNEKDNWCYIPGTGIILNEAKDMAVMVVKNNTYTLNVFKIKG